MEDSAPFAERDLVVWRLPDGTIHRKHGPAVVSKSGKKEYYYLGKRHRKEGPAVKSPDGKDEYWLFGKKVSKETFSKHHLVRNSGKA